MKDYDFSTLNDKEFEILCLDLLNNKYDLNLQAFKVGKDKGIDLRYSSKSNNNEIVVQAKQYSGSKFAQLKHSLLKKEIVKVGKLKPERYIIVTSLPLSASEKDELKQGLNPFVKTSNDILGKDDLNTLLREFPHIEKSHFKLWFSSVTILETILNNAIESRTQYHLKKIKNKIPFYVVTKKLDSALKILNKEKLLLITGQPGIGKTTLADMILFEKAYSGFRVYKVENIREAEDVISNNPEDKQLFYFDDFLGSNYLEIINTVKRESQITSFVDRIRFSSNKFLLLTTRTVILNYAKENYERIGHSEIGSRQFELKLTDYSLLEKAKILYNHLFFKNIPEYLLDSILDDKFYFHIIRHLNYTPRIIDFITDEARISSFTKDNYRDYILGNLRNPSEIWRYSFNNQISHEDRCLLLTLFSFAANIEDRILYSAFENRMTYEKREHNQIIQSNQFRISIRLLLNGFILSTINSEEKTRDFSFINPSLVDFLIGYVADSYQEQKTLISSAKYFEQLNRFIPSREILNLSIELQKVIRDKISKNELIFIDENITKSRKNSKISHILVNFCRKINIDYVLYQHISEIDFENLNSEIAEDIEFIILNLNDSPQSFKFILDNFDLIISNYLGQVSSKYEVWKIPDMFRKFGLDYDEFSIQKENIFILELVVERVMSNDGIYLIEENLSEITDITETEYLTNSLLEIKWDLYDILFPNRDDQTEIEFDEEDWAKKIEGLKCGMEYEYDEYYRESNENGISEDYLIERLFEK